MARTGEYTRLRRIMMQVTMGAILLGTVGLAALVDHDRVRAAVQTLGPEQIDGPLRFRTPAKWRLALRPRLQPFTVAVAVEPQTKSGAPTHTLTIYRQRLTEYLDPAEYLTRSGLLEDVFDGGQPETLGKGPALGGQPALLLASDAPVQTRDGVGLKGELLLCTVFPSRQAVALRLSKSGELGPADTALLNQIAAAVSVDGAGSLGAAAGSDVQLSNGVKVAASAGLFSLPEPDPNRSARDLISVSKEGEWARVELAPYLALPGDQPDQIKVLLASREFQPMATDRECCWLASKASPLGPRQWRFDPPGNTFAQSNDELHNDAAAGSDKSSAATYVRAYALSGAGGAGLLVVMTSTSDGAVSDFDALWQALSPGIQVPDSGDPSPLVDAGTAFARRVGGDGWRGAIPINWPRFWLWSDETPLGLTMLSFGSQEDGSVHGKSDTVRTNWDRTRTECATDWRVGDGGATYTETFKRTDRARDTPGSSAITVKTTREGDDLSIELSRKHATAWESHAKAPPQFIPGGVLPAALAKVEAGPMLLRTERFPGCNSAGTLEPLTLLVNVLPPPADGPKSDLKCVTVESNGAGRMSRWYFKPDGALDYAEFPAGLKLRSSATPPDLGESFAKPPAP